MATFVSSIATVVPTQTEANATNQTGNARHGICEAMERIERIVLPCLLSLTVVLGIAGNATSLRHIRRPKKVSSATDVLLLGLTITNALVILSSIFSLIHLIPEWKFTNSLVEAHLLMAFVNIYGNPPFMTCIAVDQYFAVAHPIRSQAWRKHRYYVVLSIATWLVVLTLSLLAFLMTRTTVDETISCKDKTLTNASWQLFMLFSEIILFVIPVLVLLICYALTAKKLIEVGTGKESMKLMKKKVLKTISGILALLLFCFSPYHIPELYFVSRGLIDPRHRVSIFYMCHVKTYTWALTSLSAFLNPVLYIFRSQAFQWRSRCCAV